MSLQYTSVVQVFNRSKRPVQFTWDSRQFTVPAATEKGPGIAPVLEAAAWHGRRQSVYNLSVFTLKGTPVLGIVGVHDAELDQPLPEQVLTGELINRDEIQASEGLGPAQPIKFSGGPLVEPHGRDSGRVAFGASDRAPFGETKTEGVKVSEE